MKADGRLAENLAEDIEALYRIAGGDRIDNAKIRHFAPILRRILLHGDLQRVASNLRRRIRVRQIVLSDLEALASNDRNLLFYHSGEVAIGGFTFAKTLIFGDSRPVDPKQFKMDTELVRIDRFLSQRIMYLGVVPSQSIIDPQSGAKYSGSVFVSRRDLISYVCNKSGADH